MFAATFGNVHGVYKPGNVVLTPAILKQGPTVSAVMVGLQLTLNYTLSVNAFVLRLTQMVMYMLQMSRIIV